jgi:hypothetical protein
MATTTNYGWTTPDDTALVKDGASAIRSLGTSVDTTTKNLNPSTTLGDIEYRSSTANTNTRLGIGSTGNVLTVAAGVPSWAAPVSAAPTNDSAAVATNQSTSSTSYTDLATAGPAVTVTTGTKALVIVSATMEPNQNNEGYMSYAVSGATTVAAADSAALLFYRNTADTVTSGMSKATSVTLTAGSNTFTSKYRVSGGTVYFRTRSIFVMNLV